MYCAGCQNPITCVKNGRCDSGGGGSGGSGVSSGFFAFSMLTVVASFLVLGVYQYKRQRDEMRDQIRGILAEYVPLSDGNDSGMMNGSPMDFAQGFGQGGATTSLIS